MAQDGSKRASENAMASKKTQYSSRWVKVASDTRPRGFKTAPKQFHVLSEASEDPPQLATIFQQPADNQCFCLLAFSLPMGSIWPHDGPR
eukprot:3626351-Pyramimonas_sp.AAC.1